MINRTTDFRKESNSLQNSFVKFNYQNLKPMRKIVYSLMTIALLTSCSKLKKDAQTLADLKCLSMATYGDKQDKYEKQIDLIVSKYTGEDLVKLEKTATDILNKTCTYKIENDKENAEAEKELKERLENIRARKAAKNSATNMDELLDDYESYVDQYIKMYKKAMNGDVSAMSEYPALMEKAQNFEESVNEAERGGRLTTEQIKRMNSINMKMIDAMPDTSNIPDMSGY